MLRILYLHQYFATPKMAGGTRSYELARRLVAKGHEVHMITSCRELNSVDSQAWIETNEDGIRVYWCPVPYSNKMGIAERIKAFFKYAIMASARAARIRADIVFATSTPLTIAIPAIYSKRKHNIPMVFEVRDLWPEAPIAIGALKNPIFISAARYLEKKAYQHSTRIIALSPGMKQGIIERGYPADKIAVIPNASDIEFFSNREEQAAELRAKHSWLRDRPMVIYTGTLGRVNGVGYFVKLAVEAQRIDPEVRFVVIGDGIEANEIKNAASEAGVLGSNFFMMPSMPKTEVANWLAAADISTSLVINIPELWKNSANKFFDSLAAGVPIAINYGGWQADVINESGAGLVLDPLDISSSARALIKALRDEHWKKRASKAAKQLALDKFNREKLADQFEQVLLDAVQTGQR